jgi:hypothetical protein
MNFTREFDFKLDEKAQLKDILQLLDLKANSDDVNHVFGEIDRKIDTRLTFRKFEDEMKKQDEINTTLSNETCLGRWIWESGKLKNSGLAVPWEVQAANTCVENFQWDASDTTFIVCQSPGLYEIQFGFFSTKRPTIQMLVNGEPVLSLLNVAKPDSKTTSLVYHTSKSGNQISGLTHQDFLVLPSGARISFSFNGDTKTEGFLSIKKL